MVDDVSSSDTDSDDEGGELVDYGEEPEEDEGASDDDDVPSLGSFEKMEIYSNIAAVFVASGQGVPSWGPQDEELKEESTRRTSTGWS